MRVFLDANILFSAAKSDGAVRLLLGRLLERGHECWVDEYVVVEARRNLEKKGGEAMTVLDAFLPRLRIGAVRISTREITGIDWLAEKDRPVLATAIRLRCDVLVTGDRAHFGVGYGRVFEGVTIHSPRTLAESLFG